MKSDPVFREIFPGLGSLIQAPDFLMWGFLASGASFSVDGRVVASVLVFRSISNVGARRSSAPVSPRGALMLQSFHEIGSQGWSGAFLVSITNADTLLLFYVHKLRRASVRACFRDEVRLPSSAVNDHAEFGVSPIVLRPWDALFFGIG